MIGANKFDINVHTRYLLKFHLLHPFCNMFVGLWAHIMPLHHIRTCFSVLLDPFGYTRSMLAVKQFGSCFLLLCSPFASVFLASLPLSPLCLCFPSFFVLPCGASFSASFAVLSRLLLLLCCPLVLLPSAAARLSWFLPSRRVWL